MTAAEYQAARRIRARELGLCGQCCKRPAMPGRFRCAECLALQRRYALAVGDANRSAGLDRHAPAAPVVVCVDCQAVGRVPWHRADCPKLERARRSA